MWTRERGYSAVRCGGCALLFTNPRPRDDHIDDAVRSGVHRDEAGELVVTTRPTPGRVAHFERVLGRMFADLWAAGGPISWLDVGAGYGEVVEAVARIAPAGSRVTGLEPMKAKAEHARARGLEIEECYLRPDRQPVDVISVVDVFSHIPDFNAFLMDVRAVLRPGGEIFLQTGNLADLASRDEFPEELLMPDHLVFGGEPQLTAYLERAGFKVTAIERERFDTFKRFAKTVVKKILGRDVVVRPPYSSSYRQLLIRARVAD